MNNTEATIAALVGPWTELGETIVQGTQRVVELLQMNAELNSTLIMKSANPNYLPKTTRGEIANHAVTKLKLEDQRDIANRFSAHANAILNAAFPDDLDGWEYGAQLERCVIQEIEDLRKALEFIYSNVPTLMGAQEIAKNALSKNTK